MAEHLNKAPANTRWMDGVAKGLPDQRQMIFDAEYVPGGTVSPAKM